MNKCVLVFAEYGVRNGAENSWLAVARILKDRGWHFIVATPDSTNPTEFATAASQDFELTPFNLHDESGVRKSQQEIRADISQTITAVKPDLIHCNSLSTSRLVGPVSGQLDTPAAGHLRDILKLSKQAVADINCLDRIVAVSNATKNFHAGQGIDSTKCTTVHNGVDLQQFKPNLSTSIRSELGLAPQTRLITCIGQIGMRKGTDVVLRAFHELVQNSKHELFLAIVGQRNSQKQEAIEYEQQLHKLVDKFQLQNQIRFLGRRNDVAALLSNSHFLLHAARQEPLGRVLLEAAACGCPFIATDVGGTAEIVNGLESLNLTCPVDDPETMATQASRFLDNEEFHANVSCKLRSQAELLFDSQISATKIERIYEELI